jgi:hypothetical protein
LLSSDTVRLAISAAKPLVYSVVLVLAKGRAEPIAILVAAALAAGCAGSVLAGGSKLPLELHEAALSFGIGLVLLAAAMLDRPLPLARLLCMEEAPKRTDATLNVLIGGFLVLHALLHLALALTLSTTAYVVAGRIVNLTTIGVGALFLLAYRRRRQPLARTPRRG